jgi:hypothetical protein
MDVSVFKWARRANPGYECSSRGDNRFSAFYAILPDGNSIEYFYQTQIKLYPSIQAGKGKPPLDPNVDLWKEYLNLWRIWTNDNLPLMREPYKSAIANDYTLTDMFATSPVNQARALSVILNELCGYKTE